MESVPMSNPPSKQRQKNKSSAVQVVPMGNALETIVIGDTNQPSQSPTRRHIARVLSRRRLFTSSVERPRCSPRSKLYLRAIKFAVFTVLSMLVGILVVCLTAPKPPVETCDFLLISEARSSTVRNSRPASVAVGDFNGDGLLDIAVPNSGTDNIGIFLQHVNGTFSEQMKFSTGAASSPVALAVGDFNQDQRLDIAVANYGTHNFGIFLGADNGTFSPQITFSTGVARPRWLAAGDFNHDRQLDLAVVNYGTDDISIVLGDDDGGFNQSDTCDTGLDSLTYSLVVVDLNGDGKLDIAAANFGTQEVGIFLGHGDGTFASQMSIYLGDNCRPQSIAATDFNHNNLLDLVVPCSGTNAVVVLSGLGNMTFATMTTYPTGDGSTPVAVVTGDFNDDNEVDIAVCNRDAGTVGVLFGNGHGIFSQQRTFYAEDDAQLHSIVVGDFNNDTRPDIAAVSYDKNYVNVILTRRNYTFMDQVRYRTTGTDSQPRSVAIADLNNDGQRDMIVANFESDDIAVFLGSRETTFDVPVLYSTSDDEATPTAVVAYDFNGDGFDDIAVTNFDGDTVGVFIGDGRGNLSTVSVYSTGDESGPIALAVANFNGDYAADIVVANQRNDSISVLLGDGNGKFGSPIIYPIEEGSGPIAIATCDCNADGYVDAVVANYDSSVILVLYGDGQGTFGSWYAYTFTESANPAAVAVDDVNGDGRPDVVVANAGANSIAVLLNSASGNYILQSTIFIGKDTLPEAVAMADLNSDMKLDIVVANYLSYEVVILLGSGDGHFTIHQTYPIGDNSNPIWVAIDDVNEDNKEDILVVNSNTNNVELLVGYGNGSFAIQNNYSTESTSEPRSVTIGDFDHDKRPDLAVPNFYSDTVDIFLGRGDGTFSKAITYFIGFNSGPCWIAAGDFNNDTHLDLVVANSGYNTISVFLGSGKGSFAVRANYSTGHESKPIMVVASDLNNDSRLDIVVVNEVASSILVFLGSGRGTFLPKIEYETVTGLMPQWIGLADLNDDKRLDIVVLCYDTNNFEVLLGIGNGSFTNQTSFPLGSETSPIGGCLADLDGDGHQDFVVSDFYRDVIKVLFGYGDGTFRDAESYSTGSVSRPQHCVIADWNKDGWLDIAVSNAQSGNFALFLGYGDGEFLPAKFYATGSYAGSLTIATGDLNNDTVLDIVVSNSGRNTVGVFLGLTYMNGVVQSTCLTGSTPQPLAIATGQFNGDTQLDVVLANSGWGSIGLLLSQADGSFPSQTQFPMDSFSFPTSIAVSDLNADGEFDVVTTNWVTHAVNILYGNGNGSFTNVSTYPTGSKSYPRSVIVGDFNNDNKTDVVVANSGSQTILTLLKYDIGAMTQHMVHPMGERSAPQSVAVGDLNKDGWLDFVVANRDSSELYVFFGLGNGNFSSPTQYDTEEDFRPSSIALADVNADSCLDIIVSALWDNGIRVYLDDGSGEFIVHSTNPTGSNSGPTGTVAADMNNDGRLDLVTALQFSYEIGILYRNSDGTYSEVETFSTGKQSCPTSVAVTDLDGDGYADVIVTEYAADMLDVFKRSSDGTYAKSHSHPIVAHASPSGVAAADFDNDGKMDVAVANSGADNVGVMYGNGDGTFRKAVIFSTGAGSAPEMVIVGDFNNDKLLDIAVVNLGGDNVGILLGHVSGAFFSQLVYPTGDSSRPISLAVGDFNNDTRLDMVVVNADSENVIVFLGHASEDFLGAPSYDLGWPSRPVAIAAADFNNDNQLDIAVADNGTDEMLIVYGSGSGTFSHHDGFSTGAGSQPCAIVVADFNNDRLPDVAVAKFALDNVCVFLSSTAGLSMNCTNYFTGLRSQPSSLAVLDFDNDTQTDIVVTSQAANSVVVYFGYGNGTLGRPKIFRTGYQSYPFGLAVGDLNADNLTDIVVSDSGFGNINILTKTC